MEEKDLEVFSTIRDLCKALHDHQKLQDRAIKHLLENQSRMLKIVNGLVEGKQCQK